MWPSAYQFNCDRTANFDIATMHCISDFQVPSSGSTWYSCTHTGLGKGLRSVESYVAVTSDYSATLASLDVFTTTGSFVVNEYRQEGSLLAMAVLIMSTVS